MFQVGHDVLDQACKEFVRELRGVETQARAAESKVQAGLSADRYKRKENAEAAFSKLETV